MKTALALYHSDQVFCTVPKSETKLKALVTDMWKISSSRKRLSLKLKRLSQGQSDPSLSHERESGLAKMESVDSGHQRVRTQEVQSAHSSTMTRKEEKGKGDKRHRPHSSQPRRQHSPEQETSNRTGTSPSGRHDRPLAYNSKKRSAEMTKRCDYWHPSFCMCHKIQCRAGTSCLLVHLFEFDLPVQKENQQGTEGQRLKRDRQTDEGGGENPRRNQKPCEKDRKSQNSTGFLLRWTFSAKRHKEFKQKAHWLDQDIKTDLSPRSDPYPKRQTEAREKRKRS